MKIWFRFLFFRLFSLQVQLTGLFLGLYLFIDISTSTSHVIEKIPLPGLIGYYFFRSLLFLPEFLSLSFALASTFLFMQMEKKRELLSFLTSGMKRSTLLYPAFFLALLLMVCNFSHQEFFEGPLKKTLALLEKKESKGGSIRLKDGSFFVYAEKDPSSLQEVYWVKNPQEIWRMNTVSLKAPHKGNYVDVFKKTAEKKWIKSASYEKLSINPTPFVVKSSPFAQFFSEWKKGIPSFPSTKKKLFSLLFTSFFPLYLLGFLSSEFFRKERKSFFSNKIFRALSVFFLLLAGKNLLVALFIHERLSFYSLVAFLPLLLAYGIYRFVHLEYRLKD